MRKSKFVQVRARLLRSDLEALKKSKGAGTTPAMKLRVLVHEALGVRKLRIWKIWGSVRLPVPGGQVDEKGEPREHVVVTGLAVALAATEEEARDLICERAKEMGGLPPQYIRALPNAADFPTDKAGFIGIYV